MNVRMEGNSRVGDKTWNQIRNAYAAGKVCIVDFSQVYPELEPFVFSIVTNLMIEDGHYYIMMDEFGQAGTSDQTADGFIVFQ